MTFREANVCTEVVHTFKKTPTKPFILALD